MAVTAASLKERFPEFAPLADATVTAAISRATSRTSRDAFDARYDEAVELRAAHLLALSPQGQQARLEGSTPGSSLASTTYGAELLQLMREACGGPHQSGVGPL